MTQYIDVHDDFLPSYYNDYYEKLFGDADSRYPWYFSNNINHNTYKGNFYFCNVAYDRDKGMFFPQRYKLYEPLLNRLKITMDNVKRIKSNLYPLSGRRIHHQTHIDYPSNQQNLRTCLYYVHESNRFTIFDGKQKIKCKNNRAIIFDGSIPHHSTTPTDVNYACSVNIDYWGGTGYQSRV